MSENWYEIPADDFTFGNHIHTIIKDAVQASAPAFANDLPGREPWRVKIGQTLDRLVLRWQETGPTFISTTDRMTDQEALGLLAAAGDHRSYADLKAVPELTDDFGSRKLIVVLDVVNGRIDGGAWVEQVLDWLCDEPARKAEAENMTRVKAAIPSPPEWDIGAIAAACWIVESDATSVQGTAFMLDGVGFVTCHHVLHAYKGGILPDLRISHVSDPSARFPIQILRTSEVLDLSVFSSPAPVKGSLVASNELEIKPLAHVAVCGFPNYRLGSSCSVSPGTVVATRMARGAVRRLLTNAGIVAGMSGGPAISSGRKVIGVCANGASYMQETRDTEDQAIIPIAAVEIVSSVAGVGAV